MEKERVQIANYVLTEATKFTNHFECAAWFQELEVPAGTYPVYAKLDRYGKVEDNSISCKLEGIVTASDFSAHFYGNRVGNKVNEDVGEKSSFIVHGYAHAYAHSIIKGTNDRFQLLPEFHARKNYFLNFGEYNDGHLLHFTAGIYKISDDVEFQLQEKCEAGQTILRGKKVVSGGYLYTMYDENKNKIILGFTENGYFGSRFYDLRFMRTEFEAMQENYSKVNTMYNFWN